MASNEDIVRSAYAAAEEPLDIKGFLALFAADGYLYDVSAGKTYRGGAVGDLVTGFHAAFPDMQRELRKLYAMGDVVVAELSLNGTHTGPLTTPEGSIRPTGRRIAVPCCDVWTLRDGKIASFHCYTAATVLLAQLGGASEGGRT